MRTDGGEVAYMPGGYFLPCSASYTTGMRQIIVALVFIAIALWLGIYVIPDMVANVLTP